MSPSIGWDESNPEDIDSAGQGAQEIRSLKTALRTGLDSEHNWPSGGVDAGYHKYGSARAYYGTQSQVSSSGTDGRLMVTSDTSRLFAVGSIGTALIGGRAVVLHLSDVAAPQRDYWTVASGTVTPSSFGSFTVSFANSGFSAAPVVVASVSSEDLLVNVTGASPTANRGFLCTLGEITPSGFIGLVVDLSGSTAQALNCSVNWQAVGRRIL